MTILTRQTAGTGVSVKNAPLTHAELDNNFIGLKGEINTLFVNSDRYSGELSFLYLEKITAMPGLVGYWSADPAYLYEDSAGTIPASLNGVIGAWASVASPAVLAVQSTTANKPYLRHSPISNTYYLDGNTATAALTATLGNLGSACTVVLSGPDGPVFKEGVTISATYNLATPFNWNGEIAIWNRALTIAEKALVTRYMKRYDTQYGSLVSALPQINLRTDFPNVEAVPDWGSTTTFDSTWKNGSSLTSFPLINTALGTTFNSTWRGCSSLTSFPLINTALGTNFNYAWYGCSSLTSFPLINTALGTNFNYAWYGCSSLTSFPLINTALGTTFNSTWRGCSSLTSFPLINTALGAYFNYAWYGCSSLTSFPLINTALGTNFYSTWYGCSSLTSFPLINTALGTYFNYAWGGCSSLTSFPANFFDAWNPALIANDCFTNAWYNCTALTEQSVQNILVSIAASGKSAPATGTVITLNGAATLATIQANSTLMAAVATLKSRNWTPNYKGTNL